MSENLLAYWNLLLIAKEPPIFDSPGVFTILAIIMALAAYLRQVALAWQDLINMIEGRDERTPFPWKDARNAIRKAETRNLQEQREKLAHVTTWLFFALIGSSTRVLLYAAFRNEEWPGLIREIKDAIDLTMCFGGIVLTLGLSIMHFRARKKERRLRDLAVKYQKLKLPSQAKGT